MFQDTEAQNAMGLKEEVETGFRKRLASEIDLGGRRGLPGWKQAHDLL